VQVTLRQLISSYDQRLRRLAPPSRSVGHLCVREMRDTIVAPVAAIAQQNPELSDAGVRHLLRVTLARRLVTPPRLAADAPAAEVRRRDDAWSREIRRVRATLEG
jgi:hypothetical protein